ARPHSHRRRPQVSRHRHGVGRRLRHPRRWPDRLLGRLAVDRRIALPSARRPATVLPHDTVHRPPAGYEPPCTRIPDHVFSASRAAMLHSRRRRSAALAALMLAAALLGCGDEPAGAPVIGFVAIEPPAITTLSIGGTLRLRAV